MARNSGIQLRIGAHTLRGAGDRIDDRGVVAPANLFADRLERDPRVGVAQHPGGRLARLDDVALARGAGQLRTREVEQGATRPIRLCCMVVPFVV